MLFRSVLAATALHAVGRDQVRGDQPRGKPHRHQTARPVVRAAARLHRHDEAHRQVLRKPRPAPSTACMWITCLAISTPTRPIKLSRVAYIEGTTRCLHCSSHLARLALRRCFGHEKGLAILQGLDSQQSLAPRPGLEPGTYGLTAPPPNRPESLANARFSVFCCLILPSSSGRFRPGSCLFGARIPDRSRGAEVCVGNAFAWVGQTSRRINCGTGRHTFERPRRGVRFGSI